MQKPEKNTKQPIQAFIQQTEKDANGFEKYLSKNRRKLHEYIDNYNPKDQMHAEL